MLPYVCSSAPVVYRIQSLGHRIFIQRWRWTHQKGQHLPTLEVCKNQSPNQNTPAKFQYRRLWLLHPHFPDPPIPVFLLKKRGTPEKNKDFLSTESLKHPGKERKHAQKSEENRKNARKKARKTRKRQGKLEGQGSLLMKIAYRSPKADLTRRERSQMGTSKVHSFWGVIAFLQGTPKELSAPKLEAQKKRDV